MKPPGHEAQAAQATSVSQLSIDGLRTKAEPRMFVIMHTLLYPGVLGSLMYAAPDNIAAGRTTFGFGQFVLACALFAMFVMDYTHSVTKDNRDHYSRGTFFADFLIVILLFLAGQQILGTRILPDVHPAWLLCGVKAASICWEVLKHRDPATADDANRKEEAQRAMKTDGACFLLYFLVGVSTSVSKEFAAVFLTLVLFVDAVLYVTYAKYRKSRRAHGAA